MTINVSGKTPVAPIRQNFVNNCAGDLLNDVRMRSLTNFCPAQNRRDKNISDQNQYLKCHYDQILDIHFFYIFGHNRSFPDFLPNFNLLRTLELAVFGPLFLRIYGRH